MKEKKLQSKQSWRHHFLPQFYIKEFCNDEDKIHVFNKMYEKYEYTSSKYIFFEPNRNKFENALGDIDDTMEKILAYLDSNIAPILKKVNNGILSQNTLDVESLRFLLHLAYLTKWRNPAYDESVKDVKKELSVDDLGLGIKLGDIRLDINLEQQFESELSQEFKRLLLAIQPFRFKDDYKEIFKNSLLLGSDIPVILGDCPFHEFQIPRGKIFEDFIFPIGNHLRLVYSSRVDKREMIQLFEENEEHQDLFFHHFSMLCDLSTYHMSEKYVACSDLEHLTKIVTAYNLLKNEPYKLKNGKYFTMDMLSHNLFNMLHKYNEPFQ